MALAPASIATSIATLSITGVTIRDLSAIATEVFARDCPMLMPDPEKFLTGFSVTRETLGTDAVAVRNVKYTLNYLLFFREVGEGRGLFDYFQTLITLWGTVQDAFIANSVLSNSAVIESFPSSADVGLVSDPTGKQFFGFPVSIQVMEYVNP